MFTKIADGILKMSLIAGIIGSIIIGIFIGVSQENGFLGFILILLFIVLVILVHTGIGVIIEMAVNISDCKRILEHIYENNKTEVVGNADNTAFSKYSTSYDLEKMLKDERFSPLGNYWNCSKCGEQNTSDSLYCVTCGNRKS